MQITPPVPMAATNSSNVKELGHDGATTMYARFSNGIVYQYPGTSVEMYLELLTAESPGKHIRTLPSFSGGSRLPQEPEEKEGAE